MWNFRCDALDFHGMPAPVPSRTVSVNTGTRRGARIKMRCFCVFIVVLVFSLGLKSRAAPAVKSARLFANQCGIAKHKLETFLVCHKNK